jgi:hypothetical protein
MVIMNENYFSGVSRFGVLGPIDSLFLYCYGPYGDTLWTHFVAKDSTLGLRATALTAQHDLLLAGIHYPGWVNGTTEAFVYRLDSLGAIIESAEMC